MEGLVSFLLTRDNLSYAFGIASIVFWGVAEIPQICVNYKNKSADGLSYFFVISWLVGDIFNVTGCFLEPVTVPTQLYTALLYSVATLLLVSQKIYYAHFYHREQKKPFSKDSENLMEPNQLRNYCEDVENQHQEPSSPITVKPPVLYFMSARNLTMSPSRIPGSFSPRTLSPLTEPLLEDHFNLPSSPPSKTKNLHAAVIPVMPLMILGSFCIYMSSGVKETTAQGKVLSLGRKLLQDKRNGLSSMELDNNTVGSLMGWAMTVAYVSGRVPQIHLNHNTGDTEKGLTPWMFIFALLGNLTYVASILVRSMDWFMIFPNLPWLVDAAGCVLLDVVILIQLFVRYLKPKELWRSSEPSILS